MYGYNCKQCKKVISLIDKEEGQTYFRLGNNEEFYCLKCGQKIELGTNDKVVRNGKNYMTITMSDY